MTEIEQRDTINLISKTIGDNIVITARIIKEFCDYHAIPITIACDWAAESAKYWTSGELERIIRNLK